MANSKSILIAEDEIDLREMYVTALSAAGFNVFAASNGEEALDILEKSYPEIDIILLDVVMPKMDGFEALKKITKEEKYKGIPIVISTNLDNDEDRAQAQEYGIAEYFVKSKHTPSELIKMLQGLIGKSEKKTI